ncbi:hypothetical protein FOZ61_009623 [Perkinsus olseni]|nr:hypothetical protein FOZ61_009623 [Perkinsus olseni]
MEASGGSDKKAEPKGQHVHGYNTRNQPLTRVRKRAADRKDEPKLSLKRQKSVNLPPKALRPQSKSVTELRQKKRLERDDGVPGLWEALKATNPLDGMPLHLKKRLAVYVSLTQFYVYWGWQSREEVEEFLADSLDLKPSSVHIWSHDFETAHYLEVLQWRRVAVGSIQRSGVPSMTLNTTGIIPPETLVLYQGFRERFRHYVRANSIGKDGSPNLTADGLAERVNSDLELRDGDNLSQTSIPGVQVFGGCMQ